MPTLASYSIFKTSFHSSIKNSQNQELVKPSLRLGIPRRIILVLLWLFKHLKLCAMCFSSLSIIEVNSVNCTMNGPFRIQIDISVDSDRQEIALVINLFIVPYILNWYAISTIPSILWFKTMSFWEKYVSWCRNRCCLSLICYSNWKLHHWFIPTKAWYQSLMTSSCNGVW